MSEEKLKSREAVRMLWVAFRNLSDVLEPDDWSDEDMVLWGYVTRHSAVQDGLGSARAEELKHD